MARDEDTCAFLEWWYKKYGDYNMTIHVLPLLKESRGNIINMSSTVCENHLLNISMYAGTKAAVEIFTKIWAKELAKDGVRVNALSIGSIETPIYGKTDLSEGGIQENERIYCIIYASSFPMIISC